MMIHNIYFHNNSYVSFVIFFTRNQFKLKNRMIRNQHHRIFRKLEKIRKSKKLQTYLSHERKIAVFRKVGLINLLGSSIPLNVMRFFATIVVNFPHRLQPIILTISLLSADFVIGRLRCRKIKVSNYTSVQHTTFQPPHRCKRKSYENQRRKK